jgi:hypothetical protein
MPILLASLRKGGLKMHKKISKKTGRKRAKSAAVSYRIKCKRTANGLSHYVPSEEKTLV